MNRTNDYDSVADLYDSYVQSDLDIDFFREQAVHHMGPVLELMAGTGRVSWVLHRANADLTCVDISRAMLAELQRKTSSLKPAPHLVCADVRWVPLSRRYGLVVIPFNSFAELITEGDQRKGLEEAYRVLLPGGRLVCTLHNPAVRRQTLDGRARTHGPFILSDGQQLMMTIEGSVDARRALAISRQTYRIRSAQGQALEKRVQEVRFALIGADDFEMMARDVGFEVDGLLGDYAGSEFGPESPFMIWILSRPQAEEERRE